MDAENTHQVFAWLWSSGQLSAADIGTLPALDIAVVINLAPPNSSNALAGEAELVSALGLAYVQIPVDWQQPKAEQFKQFVGVMQTFAGQKIWLHCAKNMRASAFIYLYRKLIMLEPETTACVPMQSIWSPNAAWLEFIHEVSGAHANTTTLAAQQQP
jgi:protein tyrosine phosphatase (PTP) superfamily phosphohydrolase (DUF442 family)